MEDATGQARPVPWLAGTATTADAALRESERLLSLIYENCSDCLYLVQVESDEHYRFLTVNERFLRVSGYSRSQVFSQPMEAVVPPGSRDLVRSNYRKVIESRQPVVYFETADLPAGERQAEITLTPIFVEGGPVTHILGTIKDVTAQKRAEAKLAHDALLLANVRDSVIVTDLDGVVTYWNEGATRLFGWTAQEMLGRPLVERFSDPAARAFVAGNIAAMGRGTPWVGEWLDYRKDGSRVWIDARVARMTDLTGQPVGLLGLSHDITERKLAEQAVRESEERLRLALDAGKTGVWDWDILTGRITWSDRVAEFFGMQPGEFDGTLETFARHLHPQDASRVQKALRASVDEDVPYLIEYRIVAKGGAVRWIYTAGTVIRDPDGRPVRMIGATTDTTERRLAEERLGTVLASIDDHLVCYDRQWRYTYVNDKAAQTLRRRKDELLGRSLADLFPDVAGTEYDQQLRRAVVEQHPVRFEHYDAALDAWFENHVYPSPDGVTVYSADVSWRKRLEEELRRRAEELAAADRKKDEFLALLAHELRNPLAPLRNGLQVMRLAAENPESVARTRAMMDRQLGHMVRLIDDLLDVSRISRNKMELRRSRILLADVVNSAVETARPLLQAAGHRLTISLPPRPIFLDADLTRLAQVFSNLLTNSAKYTDHGGEVWLTAEEGGEEVRVSLRDTGIGIPGAALPHIFDMFSQVDRSLERSTGGLGIGLALVKGLVEMHGGTVMAESDGPGQGSTFTVTLPTVGSVTEQPAVDGTCDRPAIGGQGQRILVVDDNQDSANSMATMLTLLGHEVRTAHDGVEAVDAADAFRPQVVLMDVGMPRRNGLDATRCIRAKPWGNGMTIIALTGWGQDGDRHQSREAGCDGHLVKPVSLPDLERLLADRTANAEGAEAIRAPDGERASAPGQA